MKQVRVIFAAALAVALLIALSASGSLAAEMPAVYSNVIETYRQAIAEHWEDDWDKLEEHGIPVEFRYGGQEPEIVASLIDIDADGSPELVIYDASSKHTLWNAYTIKDGKPVRLFVGAGRDRWYITRSEDGSYLFENEGSSGASNGVNFYYALRDGELVFVHGVIYDEDSMNAMNGEYALTGDESKIVAGEPWFTTTTDQRGQYKYADLVPTTEEAAKAVTASYAERRVFPKGERIARQAAAQKAVEFSKDAVRRMGVFISNFTELRMYNLPDAQNLTGEQYAMFGVMHEWVNNPKRFKIDKANNASIDASHISNAITRYFGRKFTAHRSVPDYDIKYDAKTKRYTIPAADGEMRVYARVENVTQNADKTLTMTGTLYNADEESDTYGPFTARAKRHKWDGGDTWALLSLECPEMGE